MANTINIWGAITFIERNELGCFHPSRLRFVAQFPDHRVPGALHGGSGHHNQKEPAVGPRVTFCQLCYNVAHEEDDGSGTTHPYFAIGA